MNPGLANTPLKISRSAARGGFTFEENADDPATPYTFRARRLKNAPGSEVVEAGRLRDFQIATFQIRKAEWIANYQDGDQLTEDLGGGEVLTWRVKTWAEVTGTRGLWVVVHCEQDRDGGEG